MSEPKPEDIAFLEEMELFQSLDPSGRKALFEGCMRVELAEDETLFNAGDPPGKLYVVQDGWVAVAIGKGKDQVDIAEVGPGALLGEMGELTDAPRSARAYAALPSVVLALDGATFVKSITGHPPAALVMMRMLSDRVSSANAFAVQRSSALG